ncbi:MAG: hypothetical protein ABI723_04985 [Bacteroidia bacterium]
MRNYEWEGSSAIHQLSATEAAEPVVVITDKRVIEYIYNKDGEIEQYYFRHRIVHINESKSVDEYNKIYIPVRNPDMLISFKARSVNSGGKSKEMLLGEMKPVTEKGQVYMSLAVDGLEKGSELEYYYTTKRYTTYSGSSEFVQSGVLTRQFELDIISPENLIMKAKVYNGTCNMPDTLIGKKRFVTAVFNNVAPSNDEKYAIEDANLTRIEYKLSQNTSTGKTNLMSFADAGNKFYQRLSTMEKDETKAVEKLASKLDLKSKTDEDKVRAIESCIKTSFDIRENADGDNLATVIKKEIADEFGANKLCFALSKIAGLKLEIVVTSSRYSRRFDPDFESWNYLEDVMFFYPSINKYVMPANFVSRVGDPPAQYSGCYALFIKEVGLGDIVSGVTTIKKLPDATAATSHDNMEIAIRFSQDMLQVVQHTHRSMAGFAAIGVRPYYFYAQPDKKKELLDEVMKMGVEGAKVVNIDASNYNLNTNEADKDFIINADITYSSLLEKADKTYLFKVGAVIGPQVEMYQDKPRQKPMEINFPHNLDRTITITVPTGYVAKGLDAINMNITGGETGSPTMGFISSYTQSENKIEIKIHEFYNNLTYPVNQYDQFRKVINASADFNKVTLVLEKTL